MIYVRSITTVLLQHMCISENSYDRTTKFFRTKIREYIMSKMPNCFFFKNDARSTNFINQLRLGEVNWKKFHQYFVY